MIFNNNLKLHVSLKTICENYEKIKSFTKRDVAVVLKANAYGLGMGALAGPLVEAGAGTIFVATVCEGVALRQLVGTGVTIFVLNAFHRNDLLYFDQAQLRPVICSVEQLKLWRAHSDAPIILHFDTGMNRLGLNEDEVGEVLENLKGARVDYVMSHMACAEHPDDPHNARQLARFKSIIQHFPGAQYSLAASESLNLPDDYFFHMLRIGKALYGSIQPFPGKVTENLKFTFKTQARILQTRILQKGDSIGYGATYVAPESKNIATIGVGFADGLPRACSNQGVVYVGDHEAPILGRVSMDLTVIDVSHIPSELISTETWVDLIRDRRTFYKQAADSNSGIYELVTRLGNRYARIYDKT
ncbi:MAG: alanine racemase [Alphaproteobacteria bacterium]